LEKRALVAEVAGQDGPDLAAHLLERGYEVFGLVRRSASAELVGAHPPLEDDVQVEPAMFRLAEADRRLGDPGKACARLWRESVVTVEETIVEMVGADFRRVAAGTYG
jgi:GDP-D-mannose dehydratase